MQDFIDCQVDIPFCTVDCNLPASTPHSPSSAPRCDFTSQPLNDCLPSAGLFSRFDRQPCYDCVNNADRGASYLSCADYVEDFCPVFVQCEDICSGCLTYQEEWFNCAAGGDSCTIDCLGDGDQIANRLLEERDDCQAE